MIYDMSGDERRELIVEFLTESEPHIQLLNKSLLTAEELLHNDKPVSADEINDIYKSVHAIKGVSVFLGFLKLNLLSNEMEKLINKVRKKDLPFLQDGLHVLFEAFEAIEILVKKLKEESNENYDINQIISDLKKCWTDYYQQTHNVVTHGVKNIEKEEKYFESFISETAINIDDFNKNLLAFEADTKNKELLNELFRLAHCIKGSAGMISHEIITQIAHKMEDVLEKCRSLTIIPNENVISSLFKASDAIKKSVDLLVKRSDEVLDISEIIDDLEKGSGHIEAKPFDLSFVKKENIKKIVEEGANIFKINFRLLGALRDKSMKMWMIEEKLSQAGEVISLFPAGSQIKDEDPADILVEISYASMKDKESIKKIIFVDGVEDLIIKIEDAAPFKKTIGISSERKFKETKLEEKSAPIELSTVRIDIKKLDYLINLAGELAIMRSRFAKLVNEFHKEFLNTKKITNNVNNILLNMDALKQHLKSLEVEGESLVLFKERISSSVENLKQITNVLDTEFLASKHINHVLELDETTSDLGKISSDIQSGVMQIRMVPIEGVFSRFKRLVRDLAKENNKNVGLFVVGEDTELDKKVIDALGEPLTHMIRNAIDHGIEPSEKRKSAGKSERATLILTAAHKGNSVCIEVGDDGRGIDPEKIVKHAIEKGLISAEDAENLTDKEKIDFIFEPGFSTAEKVTDLSGRGVGMDVVKKMLETVNGTIDVETEYGMGTRFIMRIPLTLAIIQALLVMIEDEVFALPLEYVVEILQINKVGFLGNDIWQ